MKLFVAVLLLCVWTSLSESARLLLLLWETGVKAMPCLVRFVFVALFSPQERMRSKLVTLTNCWCCISTTDSVQGGMIEA